MSFSPFFDLSIPLFIAFTHIHLYISFLLLPPVNYKVHYFSPQRLLNISYTSLSLIAATMPATMVGSYAHVPSWVFYYLSSIIHVHILVHWGNINQSNSIICIHSQTDNNILLKTLKKYFMTLLHFYTFIIRNAKKMYQCRLKP